MEVAGFALSVTSAASLFVTCIQCFDIIVKGKSFSEDYEQLFTLFSLQRARFGLWGESVGLIPDPYGRRNGYDANLDRPDIRPLVESTLNHIRLLLQKVDQVDDKYTLHTEIPRNGDLSSQGPDGLQVFKTSFDRFKAQIKKNQKAASPWKVTQWAIHDETKLRGIVDHLRELVDGLESITKSLGLLADQRTRLNDEIESISDVESLKLLRDASLGQLTPAQFDVSDSASRRLTTVAESMFEQKALNSDPTVEREDDSFFTAQSKVSAPGSANDLWMPGSWPRSITSTVLGPRILKIQLNKAIDVGSTQAQPPCEECIQAKCICERVANEERCLRCARSNVVCQLVKIHEVSLTGEDEAREQPQNQRWMAEIMQKSRPQIIQSFEKGEEDYGARLSSIKAEDEEQCQKSSIKLIAQAEIGSSAAKRMFLELRNIRTGKVPFVSAVPVGNSLDKVLASIEGPLETPYEGGIFWIAIRISQTNALLPPMMKFQTKVYHPNISPQGLICADFGDKWNAFHADDKYNTKVTSMWYRGRSSTPQWTLGALLTAICGLLACPDVDDPLVPEIAQLYLQDYQAYCENARLYTKRYATGQRPDEASLSFLEEEIEVEQIVNSGEAAVDLDHPTLDQDQTVSQRAVDTRSTRAIREFDDEYLESLRAENWKFSSKYSNDNMENNEGQILRTLRSDNSTDDSSPSTMSSTDDEDSRSNFSDLETHSQLPWLTSSTEPQATGPDNFGDYFPTKKRLFIRHDDNSEDGIMSLRVDTEGHHKKLLTLFYFRMNYLKSRKFSIRRYEKHSGREVCRTNRLYVESSGKRHEKEYEHTLASSKAYSSNYPRRASSVTSVRSLSSASSLKSIHEDVLLDNDAENSESPVLSPKKLKGWRPTAKIRLVFNNYARLELSRRGGKKSRRYEFDHWGFAYVWQRITVSDSSSPEIGNEPPAFRLERKSDGKTLAHIVPELQSPQQVRNTEHTSAWIAPHSMWISDEQVVNAVSSLADVIVCSGLVALIDDSIESRFHKKERKTTRNSIQRSISNFEWTRTRELVSSLFRSRKVRRRKSAERELPLSPVP